MNKGGDIVFENLWRIYRQDIGMGDCEYGIFHNGEYFAHTDSLTKAERIIRLVQKAGEP
jgi:hypothetical protein